MSACGSMQCSSSVLVSGSTAHTLWQHVRIACIEKHVSASKGMCVYVLQQEGADLEWLSPWHQMYHVRSNANTLLFKTLETWTADDTRAHCMRCS
jgi:hypothetical protein